MGSFLESPEKPFVKLRPTYSVKLVFSYVVKRIKIKITAKFRASRHLRFEDTKRIMSHEMRPKSFETLEKRAPGTKRNKKETPDQILVKDLISSKFLNTSEKCNIYYLITLFFFFTLFYYFCP